LIIPPCLPLFDRFFAMLNLDLLRELLMLSVGRMLDLAAAGGKVLMAVSARSINNRRQQATTAQVIEVADYVAALQREARPNESTAR
jgi:hypothetical protein